MSGRFFFLKEIILPCQLRINTL